MSGDAAASFTVPADHPSLAGHFPGHPVAPGVLILDHMLDAAQGQGWGRPSTLLSVKFKAPLRIGDACDLSFTEGRRGITVTATQNGEAVAVALFRPEGP